MIRAAGHGRALGDPKGTKQWITLFVINAYGEIYTGWTRQQLDSIDLPPQLGIDYVKSVAALVPGVQPDPKKPDTLSRTITADEINRVFEQFAATVTRFVQQIRKS